MNKASVGLFIFLAAACAWAAPGSTDPVQVVANAPLRFEPSGTGYLTRGLRFSSALHADHMDLRSHDEAMRITFRNASRAARLEGVERQRSVSNLIHGRDASQWRTVANYATVREHDLYPGIDLVYYGNHGDLEYDLVVKAGADPRKIQLQIAGVEPTVDAEGNLNAAFIQKRPVAYQIAADGSRQAVASRYRRNADGSFGFQLGRYDRTRELVIDPTLTFSLYIAGGSQDTAKAIGHDANGYIYVAGITLSSFDFEVDPNTGLVPGGPQFPSNDGGYDCFIVQVNPAITDGNPVGFATFLGGTGDDILNDMVVGPSGLIYVTGYTRSTDFPAGTVAGFQTTLSGNSDAFVAIFDPTQQIGAQLVYSSYLGGGTGAAGNGVAVDSQGRVFITGTTNSSEVPVVNGLPAGLNGGSDAFVAGFDATRSGTASLFFSTFLGGSSFEQGYGITAAPDGTLWVAGQTFSGDFPLAGNSVQGSYSGGADAFVAQIDPNAGALLYSSYLGGSSIDSAQRVKLDSKGRVIVTGYTLSGDFPITGGSAIQASYKGAGDTFVTVLNPLVTGNSPLLVYSTYFGGTGSDLPTGLTVDAAGAIYVTGYTGSFDLPVSGNALTNQRSGGQDGFVLKLDPTVTGAAGNVYSSYIASTGTQIAYGVDVDAKGIIYVTGSTTGGVFDALNGAGKGFAVGNSDGFLMGISPQ